MKFNRAQNDNLFIQLRDATDELRRRLLARQGCSAEELLRVYPRLRAEDDLAVRLIIAEWAVRLELGETPSMTQCLERFPQWRDRLETRFYEEHWLGMSVLENTPTVPCGRQGEEALNATQHGRPQVAVLPLGDAALSSLEIQREIGRGAMGVVYLAWDKMLDRAVALKKMRADLLDKPEAVLRFYHEARVAAQLNHPNIIAIHSMGRIDDQHGFTMPLATSNLDQQRSRFASASSAVALLTKIARAVHAAHQHGLVHRDLKPANILLDERDEPLVADFGLAVLLTDVQRAEEGGPIVGTPHYMAPEQFGAFAGRISEATDVWALGVMLYELLAQKRPFLAMTMSHLQRVICQTEPAPLVVKPRGVDSGLQAIVRRCLEKKPENRYASAEALARDLDNWRDGQPLQAQPEGWRKGLWRLLRRCPSISTAATLLLVFGVILAVLFATLPVSTPLPIPKPLPPPEDPDVVAVRALTAQVKNGDRVEFVRPGGQLARYRWIHESGGVAANEKKEGVDIHTLRPPALLELLPHVPLEHYEFRAEAKVMTPHLTEMGIYVLHHADRDRPVPAHSFLSLSFNEDLAAAKTTKDYWFISLQYQDQINSHSQLATVKLPPTLGDWHTFTVEVTPEEVQLRWDNNPGRKLTKRDLDASAERIRLGRKVGGGEAAVPAPMWDGGVGVYLVCGQATYRSITLKALP